MPGNATVPVFGQPCGESIATLLEAVLDGENVLLGHRAGNSWFGPDYHQVVDVTNGTVRAEFPHRARTASASADGRSILMKRCLHDDRDDMATDDCLWDLSSGQIEVVPRESVENLFDGNTLTAKGKLARNWTSGRATPHGFALFIRWEDPLMRIYNRKGRVVAEGPPPRGATLALHGMGTRLAALRGDRRVACLPPYRQGARTWTTIRLEP